MKRKLSNREYMVHIMEEDRVITIAGIRANNRNVDGNFNVRVGVSIASPLDDFEHTVGFDKALGRAEAKNMKVKIDSPDIMKEVLLNIGQRVVDRIDLGERPYRVIPIYNIPALYFKK